MFVTIDGGMLEELGNIRELLTPKPASEPPRHGFGQGHLLSALLTFILVALVIFIIVKYTMKLIIE